MASIIGTSKKERFNSAGTYYWDEDSWVFLNNKSTTGGVDNVRGRNGDDLIFGGGGADKLFGQNGNDLLNGGSGRDKLTGEAGADKLIGGSRGDYFIYNAASDSADRSGGFHNRRGDTISGFTTMTESAAAGQQDKLDFQPLISNIGHALTWNGNLATSYGAWQTSARNTTYVNADTTGDGKADLVIRIASKEHLQAGDFLGVSIDPDAPDVPTIDLKASSDTGASNTDDYTSDKTPTLIGTAEPFTKILVYDGATLLGSALTNAAGNWKFTAPGLDKGFHNFTAIAKDGSGNASGPSSILAVEIDSAAAIAKVVETTIASGADDAEQALKNGRVVIGSSDLELSNDIDAAGAQLAAMRFHDLGIPVGAVITSAWIQFTAKERDFEAANLTVQAQNSANAAQFQNVYHSISDRGTTDSVVSWAPEAWTLANESGNAQRTVDISVLVQEVINKTNWSPDNAIAFIFGGNGMRTAFSYDGNSGKAPVLHIEYQIGDTNVGPVAVDDTGIIAEEDKQVIINVLANDSDPDGNPLTVGAAGQASHGKVFINGDGTITYTPDENYTGADSFKYTIADGHGGLAYGTVSLNVAAVNDAPKAIDDSFKTQEGTLATLNLLRNDRDVDGDTLTVTITGAAQHGTTTINSDGTVDYTPNGGYNGVDSFTYQIGDGKGGTDTATATIHVGDALYGTTTFAAFGDYGVNDYYTTAIRALMDQLNPDSIVTLGDNFYAGAGTTFDDTVGKYFSDYIGNYQGTYGPGAVENKFFTSLSEHEYKDIGLQAYQDYFTLPESSSHNERYYDFIQGSVHFFILNTDPRELDGIASNSVQAQWLQAGLANSDTPWQVVIAPESPYSSGSQHGSQPKLQWDFEAWGADAVLSGGDHSYERIIRDDNNDNVDMPYFVVGTGGADLYPFAPTPVAGSEFQYNATRGALFVTASDTDLTFDFYSINKFETEGVLQDTYTLTHPAPIAPVDALLF